MLNKVKQSEERGGMEKGWRKKGGGRREWRRGGGRREEDTDGLTKPQKADGTSGFSAQV